MNEFSSGGPNPWNIYTSTDPNPNPSSQTQTAGGIIGQEGQQQQPKSVGAGTSSAVISAISFGFVATAILIAMFIVMAIFEHLLRPRTRSDAATDEGSTLESGQSQDGNHGTEKLGSPQNVSTSYSSTDISVLMPGQNCPTFIAQPAPLPCRREGIQWPSYDHSFVACVSP